MPTQIWVFLDNFTPIVKSISFLYHKDLVRVIWWWIYLSHTASPLLPADGVGVDGEPSLDSNSSR